MPTFNTKPLNPSPIATTLRRHPFLYFGLPFISILVVSSFALAGFTQTRYDYQARRQTTLSKEEELGMAHGRKKVDLKEEYYRLSGLTFEPTSIPTPSGDPLPLPDLSPSPSSPPSSADVPREDTKKKKKFSMVPVSQDDFENVRVKRPAGIPEWGYVADASPDAPVKGKRKEDRWV